MRSTLDDCLAHLAAACPAAVMEAEAAKAQVADQCLGLHEGASVLSSNSSSCSNSRSMGSAVKVSRSVADTGHHDDGGAAPVADAREGATSSLIAAGLARWDALVDTRMLEVCCQGLDACCAALQRAAVVAARQARRVSRHDHNRHKAAAPGQTDPAAEGTELQPGSAQPQVAGGPLKHDGGDAKASVVPRKISALPTGTRRAHASLVAAPGALPGLIPGTSTTASAAMIPASLSDLLTPPKNGASIQLQQALLAQYSTDEHPVKLREVVGYVSDLVSMNAFMAAMPKTAPAALAAANAELQEAARAIQAEIMAARSEATPEGSVVAVGSADGGDAVLPVTPPVFKAATPFTPSPSPFSWRGREAGGVATPASGAASGFLATPTSTAGTAGAQRAAATGERGAQVFTPAELEAVKSRLREVAEAVSGKTVRALLEAAEPLCMTHVNKVRWAGSNLNGSRCGRGGR